MKLNELATHPALQGTLLNKQFAQKPFQFVDVGARGGVHDLVEPFASKTSVLAFEPDETECQRLLTLEAVTGPWADFNLLAKALDAGEGERVLHLLSAPTNHSLLPPNPVFTARYNMEKWQLVDQLTLETTSLDTLLASPSLAGKFEPELLKLDTQGSEFEILEGAIDALGSSVVAIVTEVSFAELYQGQKLFSEVEQLLRKSGFSFYGFDPIFSRSQRSLDKSHHITRERAFFTDAVFFRDPLDSGDGLRKFSHRQAQALFVSAVLLGFFDFALELALSTWATEQQPDERTAIQRFIQDISFKDPAATKREAEDMLAQLNRFPEKSNLVVGHFVDQRRDICDYHDVFNTMATPVPKE